MMDHVLQWPEPQMHRGVNHVHEQEHLRERSEYLFVSLKDILHLVRLYNTATKYQQS